MLQAPENNVIVKVNQKHTGSTTNIMLLSALQNGTTIDPADFANIQGEVISLPKRIRDDKWHEGYTTDEIYEGDIAIFSYQVIYDLVYKAETEKLEYRNMIKYHGEEYFLADITRIFAVIRGGDLIMINGYVMAYEYPAGIIVLQNQSKKVKGTTTSKVMHIGKPRVNKNRIDVRMGDEILYSPFSPQHYKIGDNPFIILRQDQILGRL